MGEVTIVCPTHGRAGQVLSFGVFGEDLLLCVAESQAPLYREAYPDAKLDVHPDSVVGTGPKRQWMYDKYGSLFMVDDDVPFMTDVTVHSEKVDPAVARDIVARLGDMAEQMGAKVWGFPANGNPLLYRPHAPFRLKAGVQLGCALGMHPSDKLYFPADPDAHEDVWISGLNAYHHRFMLQDQRYTLPAKYGLTGGWAARRTKASLKVQEDRMRDAFGDAFQTSDESLNFGTIKVPW